MADNKLIIQLDLEKGDVNVASSSIEKSAKEIGEKAGDKFSSGFKGGLNPDLSKFTSKITKAISLVGSLATAYGIFKSIDAAQSQEDAINSLNSALLNSKNASTSAVSGIVELSNELQKNTRFSDDAIVKSAALLQSLGDLSEDGLKVATRATADLATALRVDLETAATLMGKAAEGEIATLTRYGLAVKKGATDAETFANALTTIQGKFGGMAERDVNTFSGAIAQLKNTFDDMLEPIGEAITKNPQFIILVKESTKAIRDLTETITKSLKDFNLFEFITENLIPFNEAIITYVVAPLELVANVGDIMQSTLNLAFAKVVAGLGNVGWAIAKILDTLNIGEKLSEDLKNFEQTSSEVAHETGMAWADSINSIGDFEFADMLSSKNDDLAEFFNTINEQATEQTVVSNEKMAESASSIMSWGEVFKGVYNELNTTLEMSNQRIDETNERMKKFAKESSVALRDGFGKAAGQAFAALGAAMAKGENALDAFTKVLFKALADQAVALGTKFMLEGTAMLFSINPADNARAPFLIQSGAALAAFGGFLGATAGAGGGTSGSTGGNTGVGAGNVDMRNDVASPEAIDEERKAPQTNVSIQVNGSLVHQEELGEFITRTLNESFGKQGVTLTDARFA